eukprot:TRINITY_DN29808_c0_g1_i1.p1 TRINITY_DN29808_c0_g1~~TRINITY_DN29808_c0_g1_i1.p1  ORF type:complete len:371 (+),score=53.47 TRINITY_DN29808_c0_g1_i1:137-1249(+)
MPRLREPRVAHRANAAKYGYDLPRWGVHDDDEEPSAAVAGPAKSCLKKGNTKQFGRSATAGRLDWDEKSTTLSSNDSCNLSDGGESTSPRSFEPQGRRVSSLRRGSSNVSDGSVLSVSPQRALYRRANSRIPDEQSNPSLVERLKKGAKTKYKNACAMMSSVGPCVIILEFDDILCPTWFIKKYVIPKQRRGTDVSDYRVFFYNHQKAVRKFLMQARAVAHVVIITTAKETFVADVCGRYFPELNFLEFVESLGIDTYYIEEPESESVGKEAIAKEIIEAKRATMYDILLERYTSARATWNVLCISCASIEAEALRQCLKPGPGQRRCKAVRIPSRQVAENLTASIEGLTPNLAAWAASKRDIDTFHFVT